ncbi:hypothetical protein F0562_015148 [Nyssa sinensis]|uniref:Uncharacterized protein n=1 Tax=Nyssa sinensis TaxID=561372 RepID=A0A5J4ZIM9_9ASTE|nr:hypothetical protein F0562_015148 [Nyssa sinensis]
MRTMSMAIASRVSKLESATGGIAKAMEQRWLMGKAAMLANGFQQPAGFQSSIIIVVIVSSLVKNEPWQPSTVSERLSRHHHRHRLGRYKHKISDFSDNARRICRLT